MPEVLEENEQIFSLFNLASTQWRMGPAGITGLNYGVLTEMAKAMNIKVNRFFFEKIKAFETVVLTEIQKRNKRNG